MMEEIRFLAEDRILIVAPHPDDECLGASAALILAPEQTDIVVLTDGSHGNPDRSIPEEAEIRRRQFEAEMAYVRPHAYTWLGVEDTTLSRNPAAADPIDFTQYTRIFLPWSESLHPDHRAAFAMCKARIRSQGAKGACFCYEIFAPFRNPTHYVDITAIEPEKRKLIRFHRDQAEQEQITLALNAFRAAQMMHPDILFAETYWMVDPQASDSGSH